MIYKYRITGDSGAIFIVGVFPAPRISQQDFKGAMIFWQEEHKGIMYTSENIIMCWKG